MRAGPSRAAASRDRCRRAGKDSVASAIATHASAIFDPPPGLLRPGETPLVLCLARNRNQAGIVNRYIRGLFKASPILSKMIVGETAESISLDNRVDVVVRLQMLEIIPILAPILLRTRIPGGEAKWLIMLKKNRSST
jgi:hypothetical protein